MNESRSPQKVIALLLGPLHPRLPALAEACLALSPQVAVGSDAVFLEIGASHRLFTEEECIRRVRELVELLDLKAKIGLAPTVAGALASARYGIPEPDRLPVEALGDFLNPFAPGVPLDVQVFRKLGVATLGDFKKIPRGELPSRFGKQGLLAYERLLSAHTVAWPRFTPPERLEERADLDGAARVETLEPVLFLLRTVLSRVFLRLYAKREKLAAFRVTLHLNRFSSVTERVLEVTLPLPQSELKNVHQLTAEKLEKELQKHPLENALEGLGVHVTETAPFPNTQRDFFSKREEEREAWAALVGRLGERLGNGKAFRAAPAPRLLPEASWSRTLDEHDRGTAVPAPSRPLRLLDPPLRLERDRDRLVTRGRQWRFTSFHGPEKLKGEWWLGGFEREYFHVETDTGETLWVFTAAVSSQDGAPRGLWLHGVYD